MRVYFAVPTHYTIGVTFATFAEAEQAAREKIRPFDGIPGESRAFVDIRVSNQSLDASIARFEVFSASETRALTSEEPRKL